MAREVSSGIGAAKASASAASQKCEAYRAAIGKGKGWQPGWHWRSGALRVAGAREHLARPEKQKQAPHVTKRKNPVAFRGKSQDVDGQLLVASEVTHIAKQPIAIPVSMWAAVQRSASCAEDDGDREVAQRIAEAFQRGLMQAMRGAVEGQQQRSEPAISSVSDSSKASALPSEAHKVHSLRRVRHAQEDAFQHAELSAGDCSFGSASPPRRALGTTALVAASTRKPQFLTPPSPSTRGERRETKNFGQSAFKRGPPPESVPLPLRWAAGSTQHGHSHSHGQPPSSVLPPESTSQARRHVVPPALAALLPRLLEPSVSRARTPAL
eukprot:CAMPEP_0115258196 /NCGR_PEP_ID=MMETSP0270-20121206/47166_1 /TAXON_ID=71861 /ORGANISM="Scrippsiella trochoidea, Strain CCMP3099" /LENGTH=324 /DNA_ID=CAMNT_0002673931 /DNA_START=56 /DNA_END=1030 /DNA_ORIENTATION=+